jgi:hypothetical protein
VAFDLISLITAIVGINKAQDVQNNLNIPEPHKSQIVAKLNDKAIELIFIQGVL